MIKNSKLILFDIDRTLARCPKVHRQAFKFGFQKVYGVDTNIDVVSNPGKTDQQIILDVMKFNGLAEDVIKPKIKECIDRMCDYYEENVKPNDVYLLDGAKELIDELDKQGFLLGLVTGNPERIAFRKLKMVGIDHYFKLGGFSSDHILREELVKLAIKRAKDKYNFVQEDNVFIVDDSLRGVAAGLKVGIRVIGVATGKASAEELQAVRAHLVLNSLKESDKLFKFIL